MPEWVDIRDLFKKDQRYSEPYKLFIGYTPDDGEIILSGEETGLVDEDGKPISQTIKTEIDLGGWHPTLTKEGKVILVPHNATKTRLTLMGKLGHKNIKEVLQKIGANCYSNKALGAEGGYLTEKIFRELRQWLRFTAKGIYWLAEKDSNYAYLYVLSVGGGRVSVVKLYNSNGGTYSPSYALRPNINLPSNILVYVGDEACDGSTPERAMKIMHGDSESVPNLASSDQNSIKAFVDIISKLRDINEIILKNLK